MATFALTLVLAAGIFSRTIAGWIVASIEQVEPMIHYVAKTEKEAHSAVASLLSFELSKDNGVMEDGADELRKIQVEIAGHIFISKRRITHRSRLSSMLLGVLAPTFDLSETPGIMHKSVIAKDTSELLNSSGPLVSINDKGATEVLHMSTT